MIGYYLSSNNAALGGRGPAAFAAGALPWRGWPGVCGSVAALGGRLVGLCRPCGAWSPALLGLEDFAPGENHVRAADRRRWHLVCHVPVGGVVMGHLHASSAGLGRRTSAAAFVSSLRRPLSRHSALAWRLVPGENHVRCSDWRRWRLARHGPS